MKKQTLSFCKLLFFFIFLYGCSSMQPRAGFEDVQAMVKERLPQTIHWQSDEKEEQQIEETIQAILKKPLGEQEAVQIALFRNQELQAQFEELGISQADLVQAGILQNPIFSASARFPDRSPLGTNLEFSIAQSFLDIFMLSARKKLAAEQFERTKFQVSHAVLDLTARVQAAYIAALGAKQVAEMRKLIVHSSETAVELAQRLHEAGNISDLQLSNEQGLFEDSRVIWSQAEMMLIQAREELTRLMGLWGEDVSWTLAERLPDIPEKEMDLEHIEAQAIARRLDLDAAKKESEVLAQSLGITLNWRYFMVAEVGVDSERDSDGQWVTGPQLSVELPVFDQQQAPIARLQAQFRQSQNRVADLAVSIRSQVRALRDKLISLRQRIEHYRNVIIPLRESIVKFTQEEYNYMLVGAFELIAAKKEEYNSYQEYIEAIRDYWVTRSELELALGGWLPDQRIDPTAIQREKTEDAKPTKESEHKHNHGD